MYSFRIWVVSEAAELDDSVTTLEKEKSGSSAVEELCSECIIKSANHA